LIGYSDTAVGGTAYNVANEGGTQIKLFEVVASPNTDGYSITTTGTNSSAFDAAGITFINAGNNQPQSDTYVTLSDAGGTLSVSKSATAPTADSHTIIQLTATDGGGVADAFWDSKNNNGIRFRCIGIRIS